MSRTEFDLSRDSRQIQNADLATFANVIVSHEQSSFLDDEDLRQKLLLWAEPLRSGKLLETVYAPFEHVEFGAELVIVGIKPGATQAENALAAARAALRAGADIKSAARQAKIAGSFSGKIRKNLVDMLDSAGVAKWFGIKSSGDLFGTAAHLVHFTSALRNPVFVARKNYSGQPVILRHARLRQTVEDTLAAEARALPNAYWLPLWDVPGDALQHLVSHGELSPDQVLAPMPHPGGGNCENISWFRGTTKATTFSSRRASTGDLLLDRRKSLRSFFSSPRHPRQKPAA